MKTLKQRVMLLAWELRRQHQYTFSKALKAAWKEIKLRALKSLLPHKTIRVTFMKVSGEVTTRTATRNIALLPTEKRPKHRASSSNETLVTFFSLSDNDWRSFRSDNLISYQIA